MQFAEQLLQKGTLLHALLRGGVRQGLGGVRKLAENPKESLRVRSIAAEAFAVTAAGRIQIRFDTS